MGALQAANIDTLNPSMPDELQAKVTADNWRNTKQALSAVSVRQLVDIKSTTPISVTSATEATLPGFAAAFQSNGGLVQMVFKASPLVSTGATALSLKMYLDGVQVDYSRLASAADNLQVGTELTYQGVPPAGKHSVKITWYEEIGGSSTICHANTTAILRVTEVRV